MTDLIPQKIEKVFDIVQDVCEYAMVVLLAVLTLLATAQIVIRFILADLGITAVWTEQVSRYLLVVLTFIGAPYAMRTNDNISIRPLLERAPANPQRVLLAISNILIIIFSFFVILSVIAVLPRSIGVSLSNFRILTIGYAHIVLAAAFVMVALYAIEQTIELWEMAEEDFKTADVEYEDEEELTAEFGGVSNDE